MVFTWSFYAAAHGCVLGCVMYHFLHSDYKLCQSVLVARLFLLQNTITHLALCVSFPFSLVSASSADWAKQAADLIKRTLVDFCENRPRDAASLTATYKSLIEANCRSSGADVKLLVCKEIL